MKKTLLAATLWASAWCMTALADGAPKIQFDQTVYDFGKTSQVETVTGSFKYKNVGDGVLKLEPPKPSCGCTVAALKPDTLQPGESGELEFTLNLGRAKTQLEKHIAVLSNDPQKPEVQLTIKADYTPLYDVNPMTISPKLVFGTNETVEFTTITRGDGNPIRVVRLDPSKPWITAQVEPSSKKDESFARIRVSVQREGSPRSFNEFVQIYTADHTNTPASSIYVFGQMLGEVMLSPETLYWSVPRATNMPVERPDTLFLRRISIRSADGKTIAVTNLQSSLKEIEVELVPVEAGKSFELVARLDEIPTNTVSGKVSFETSVAEQPRIEVPAIINVY